MVPNDGQFHIIFIQYLFNILIDKLLHSCIIGAHRVSNLNAILVNIGFTSCRRRPFARRSWIAKYRPVETDAPSRVQRAIYQSLKWVSYVRPFQNEMEIIDSNLNWRRRRRRVTIRHLPCRSKSIYRRVPVRCSSSSIRNRAAGREREYCANSNRSSIRDKFTVSIRADHSPVFKCLKMSNISKWFAAGVTVPSVGSSRQWVNRFFFLNYIDIN